MALEFTGERYTPEVAGIIQQEHLHRYALAKKIVTGKKVLDIACGEGYGSSFLSESANHVTGVDISLESIRHAKTKYNLRNVEFLEGSCLDIPFEDNCFDVVISFETVEHLSQQELMISELSRVLKSDGILVISSPNRPIYNKFSSEPNHYHVKELDFAELGVLLESKFEAIKYLTQSHESGDCILPYDGKIESLESHSIEELGQLSHFKGSLEPKYFIAICSYSSIHLPNLSSSIAFSDSYRLTDEHLDVVSWASNVSSEVEIRDVQIRDYNQQVEQVSAWGKSLNDQTELQLKRVDGLEKDLSERYEEIKDLNSQIKVLSQTSDEISKENSKLTKKLFEVTDWAEKMNRHPILFSVKGFVVNQSRSISRKLPISPNAKQSLKRVVYSLFKRDVPLGSNKNTMSLDVDREPPIETDKDIFVFSVIDWDFRVQRPQHLAKEYAKAGYRVFFFSNHFIDRDEPGYQLEKLSETLQLYNVKLHVKGAPPIYFKTASESAVLSIKNGISKLMLDFQSNSLVSLIQHSYWYPAVKNISNSIQLYDCMDHHEGFGNVPKELIAAEREMLSNSDLVLVTSSWLEEFAKDFNTSVSVIRNGGDYDFFAQPPLKTYVDHQKRKIIGYFGAIAEWFDIELVRQVATTFEGSLVLLVGDDTVNAKQKLGDLSNLVFTGEVPYQELPYYLYAFDVCLLPFKVNELTLATNPVKVYEYLSAGKPVVCVDLPETSQFEDNIWRASGKDKFIESVRSCLEDCYQTQQYVEKRKLFASKQTWRHRVAGIEEAVDGILWPKVSVVVLTYNNLSLTKACLRSLIEVTDYPNLEIIVVDNASSDDTPAYLNEFQGAHGNVEIILNQENLGFAAGNNIGLERASGDYLVILNNDTVVTKGWALNLLRHFRDDHSLGLIGPVTNNIGNEAKIDVDYKSILEMEEVVSKYTLTHMGEKYPLSTAAFFCVMIRRDVYEKCGPISEDYGRGFFEDDDYCRRIELMGLSIACAEDVFIHHNLSASFNKLKHDERQRLFEKNKLTYEKKWGVWEPHKYRKNSIY